MKAVGRRQARAWTRGCDVPSLKLFIGLLIVALLSAPASAEPMRTLRTRHYHLHTDLPDDLAADIGQRLDTMFEEYSARLSEFTPPGDQVLSVYVFEKLHDYQALVGPIATVARGVYIEDKQILAAYLDGPGGRSQLRNALQHEAFHQFVHSAIGPDVPSWLNEGLAQYFEEGLWTNGGLSVGEVPPRRVRQLQEDMAKRRLFRFRDFLALETVSWNLRTLLNADDGITQYNQAWAMVHFLVHGNDVTGQPLRPRLIRMLKLIRAGTPADAAFAQAFSDNMEDFQALFVEYARNELEPTPDATMVERQEVLGQMLIGLHEAGVNVTSADEFRRAAARYGVRVTFRRGNLEWKTDPDPRVYFTDTTGRVLGNNQLTFSPRDGAPLPDMICRYNQTHRIRTQFHQRGDDEIEQDVIVEPLGE